MNIGKFLRTHILKNIWEWLLLKLPDTEQIYNFIVRNCELNTSKGLKELKDRETYEPKYNNKQVNCSWS